MDCIITIVSLYFGKDCFRRVLFLERFDDENENVSRMPMGDVVSLTRIPNDFETAALKIMMTRYFRGKTRFKMAVRFVISQVRFDIIRRVYFGLFVVKRTTNRSYTSTKTS